VRDTATMSRGVKGNRFGFAPVPGVPGAEPPAVVPALDPLETTSHRQYPPADFEGECMPFENPDHVPFEHRGWDADRRRVYAAMIRTDQPVARRHDFSNCGQNVHVFREATTNEVEVRPETCKDRFCLPCGQRRSRRIAIALECRMKPAVDRLMFMTLTVRGLPGQSLREQLEKLKAGWKALRRLDGWRHHVAGGAVMLEIKWSCKSGGHWHPHYHIICEGQWVDVKWLKSAWYAITGDSDQVDVQRIAEPERALSYVTKYASKPMDASFLRRSGLLDEAMRTLKGERLCALFGNWYGTPLKETDDGDETEILSTWVYEGTTRDLDCRAVKGEAAAAALLRAVNAILHIRSLRGRRSHGPPTDSDSHRPTASEAA